MATWDVTTAGGVLDFQTSALVAAYNSCFQIDTTHFINFWRGIDLDGFVQVFTVNTTTWAVTTAAASLEFDTEQAFNIKCIKIDTNHFLNFWADSSSDGKVQVFTVNTSTWAVTTAAAALEFDTQNNEYNSCCQIDSNHFINFWRGGAISPDGFAQVFTVNTSTWAVTTAAGTLQFETDTGEYFCCCKIDTNHFINFWQGTSGDGFAQVFTVNTSTWAVTTAAASLEFNTQDCSFNACFQIDSNHFINFYRGVSSDGFVQTFTVNTSTWAVTTNVSGQGLEFDTQQADYNAVYQVDSFHFINFWAGASGLGQVQVFTVNSSTYDVTTAAGRLNFDTRDGDWNATFIVDSSHFINFWGASNGADNTGKAQIFSVELPVDGPANLKSLDTNLKANIKSYNTNLLANIKSINTNV